MKRSEMLAKIVVEIPGDEYWGLDWDAAERVLKAIEEAGMAPPKHGKCVEEMIIDNNLALAETYVRTWEQE